MKVGLQLLVSQIMQSLINDDTRINCILRTHSWNPPLLHSVFTLNTLIERAKRAHRNCISSCYCYHKLSGLRKHKLIFSQFWRSVFPDEFCRLTSRCWLGWFPQGAPGCFLPLPECGCWHSLACAHITAVSASILSCLLIFCSQISLCIPIPKTPTFKAHSDNPG